MDEVELRERIAHIDLMQAQLRELALKMPNIQAERGERTAATIKLYAEAAKMRRDRWWSPAFAIAALLTAGGAAGLGWAKILGL
jgi:hypothetical protein